MSPTCDASDSPSVDAPVTPMASVGPDPLCAPEPGFSIRGADMPDASTLPCNLVSFDAAGNILAQVFAQAGEGVTITGCGSASDPFVISADGDGGSGGTIVMSGNSAILVTGDGSAENPYRIAHKKTDPSTQGTYLGFTFDEYGHMVATTNGAGGAPTSGVTGIIAGPGITVVTDPNTKIVTISLADPASSGLNPITGTFRLGGFDVEVVNNQIGNITRAISGTAGTYQFGDYSVTVNDYGSITGITYTGGSGGGAVSLSPLTFSKTFSSSVIITPGSNDPLTMSFSTPVAGSFRIRCIGSMSSATRLRVDGTLVSGVFSSLDSTDSSSGVTYYAELNALPPATYSAGGHTVTLESTDNLGVGLIDVTVATMAS